MIIIRPLSIIHRPSSACTLPAVRSTLGKIHSTNKFVRNFQQIMQNEPKFPCFSPKNAGLTKKRTQTNPILAQKLGDKPKQTQMK